MTPKEKAAAHYQKYHTLKPQYDAFLAGCAYQEQVDREVIEGLVKALKMYANEINIEPFYKEVKIPGTNNTRPSLDMRYFIVAKNALEAYHKATGQAEKE